MATNNQEIGVTPFVYKFLGDFKTPITSLSFNPNEDQLVSGGKDNVLLLWTNFQKVKCYKFIGHTDEVLSTCFSKKSLIASSSKDKTIRLWIPTLLGDSKEIKAHSAAIRSIHFSPDEKMLISGSDDKTVKIWNVKTQKFVLSFAHHKNWVRSVKFSPTEPLVATCADDKTTRIYDIRSNNIIHVFSEVLDSPCDIEFHESGDWLATGLSNGHIKIYDLRNFKLQQLYTKHSTRITKLSIFNNYLLSSSQDSIIRIFDLEESRCLFTLKGHKSSVTCVDFSKDGRYFASGADDGQIFLWNSNFNFKYNDDDAGSGGTDEIKKFQENIATGVCSSNHEHRKEVNDLKTIASGIEMLKLSLDKIGNLFDENYDSKKDYVPLFKNIQKQMTDLDSKIANYQSK